MTLLAVLFLPISAEAAGIRSDYVSKPAPAVSFPAAGGRYIDPVFGTKVIRVTDANAGTHCVHSYSHIAAFNLNNTRLLIACDYVPKLYGFDPSTNSVWPDGILWGTDGPHIQFDGASWSTNDPNKIYGADMHGTKIWKVNVANRGKAGYTMLRDLKDYFDPSWEMLSVMSMDENENVFAFSVVSQSTGAVMDNGVWVRDTNRVYVFPREVNYTVHETKVSKDGTMVELYFSTEDVVLWNFRAGTKTWLHKNVVAENAGGHFDIGRYYMVNSDLNTPGIRTRALTSLTRPWTPVIFKRPDGSLNWSLAANHVSLRSEHDDAFIGSTYLGDGTWGAFEKEIFLGFTDGHTFFRLAHTYAKGGQTGEWGYWSQPRAVISRDSHYAVWTTDLGSSSRLDVMILVIPPETLP